MSGLDSLPDPVLWVGAAVAALIVARLVLRAIRPLLPVLVLVALAAVAVGVLS